MATLCRSSTILSTLLDPSSTARSSIAIRFSPCRAARLSAALSIQRMPKRVRWRSFSGIGTTIVFAPLRIDLSRQSGDAATTAARKMGSEGDSVCRALEEGVEGGGQSSSRYEGLTEVRGGPLHRSEPLAVEG